MASPARLVTSRIVKEADETVELHQQLHQLLSSTAPGIPVLMPDQHRILADSGTVL